MSRRISEHGATLITVALMLSALVGFLALVVDVGAGYVERRRTQSVADAAALAGVQVLTNNGKDSAIYQEIQKYAVTLNPKAAQETRSFEAWYMKQNGSGGMIVLAKVGGGSVPSDTTAIQVTVTGSTPTFFANILGLGSWTASASGGGGYSPLDVMLVMDKSLSMEYDSCDFKAYFDNGQHCRSLILTPGAPTPDPYQQLERTYNDCTDCRGKWATPTPKSVGAHTPTPTPIRTPQCYWPDKTLMTPVPTKCAVAGVKTQNNCQNCQGAIVPTPTRQPITAAHAAAINFVELVKQQLGPTYPKVGLVSYSDTATLNQQLTPNLDLVENAIKGIGAESYTNIADALSKALTELTASNGRQRATAVKVIVFLTDGQPNRPGCSGSNPCEAARKAARDQADLAATKNVYIYTIGLGPGADTTLLQYIANTTHAEYRPATAADLNDVYEEIFEKIKRLRLVE